jgi:branched-chain amino acid transport system ATP-binding protein
MKMLLALKDIRIHYGKAEVIKGVTIDVTEGDAVAIVGANGAGKSTILRAVVGVVPLAAGKIWFINKRIDRMKTHEIAELGIIHIPEGRHLFPYMTVLENLKIGAYLRIDKTSVKKDLDDIFKRFPILGGRRHQKAGTLSGGEQQMLAIGRGLMANPKVLLVDEPSLALSPLLVQQIGAIIRDLHRSGITILLVEQNASLAIKVTNRCYVLEVGKVVFEGNTKEIMTNETVVRKAFLGS